jgi:hypothetical protein
MADCGWQEQWHEVGEIGVTETPVILLRSNQEHLRGQGASQLAEIIYMGILCWRVGCQFSQQERA